SKADGHGHFILLEVDGELHPFSDRNPVSTGGQHEFGTDRRDTPLSDLEDYLKSNPQKTASDYLSENFSPAERQSANAVYISNSSNVADLTVRVRQIKQVAKGQMTLARHTTANLFSSQRQIAQLTRPSRSGDEITLELINAAKALDDFSYALNHLCDACDMFIFDLEG
ncbi:MAG: hypothetical protein LBT21_08045, partial [Oscillospiraceae bacterium]|nr:hypothetical protein [Oscillospiraceae bacterium]